MKKICFFLEEKEELFLKKVAMGQDLNSFIYSYLKHNLLFGASTINNQGIYNNDETFKDEFDLFIHKMNTFGITQLDLSIYFETTQPTVSRFLKTKSRKSFLYNALFSKADKIMYHIYYKKVVDMYDMVSKLPIHSNKVLDTNSSDSNVEFILKSLLVMMFNGEVNKNKDLSEKFNLIISKNKIKIAKSLDASIFDNQNLEYIFGFTRKLYEELFLE